MHAIADVDILVAGGFAGDAGGVSMLVIVEKEHGGGFVDNAGGVSMLVTVEKEHVGVI